MRWRCSRGLRLLRVALPAAMTLALVALPIQAGARSTGTEGGFVEPVTVLRTLNGDANDVAFGWAVSELADVNGDGAQEAIVSDPFGGTNGGGAAWVYDGATGAVLHVFEGDAGALLGYAIADAGDVDGDRTHDVIVGARGANEALVYSGADWGTLHTFHGEIAGDGFGASVASAGDVNADGRADLLIGATLADAPRLNSGRAYVFDGADGSLIRTLQPRRWKEAFGSGAASTPDLNGDSVPDQIVGARNGGPGYRGRVYVFSGADGRLLWFESADLSGVDLGSFFVANAGDVNGDGVPDVYGGDYNDGEAGTQAGKAYVFSGVDGSTLRTWTGSGPFQGFGPGRSAGDVDGDLVPDVIVGSYLSGDGRTHAGKAQVFSGATGTLLRTITSTTPHEELGFDAIGIGDVDGDGHVDLLVAGARGNVAYIIAG